MEKIIKYLLGVNSDVGKKKNLKKKDKKKGVHDHVWDRTMTV